MRVPFMAIFKMPVSIGQLNDIGMITRLMPHPSIHKHELVQVENDSARVGKPTLRACSTRSIRSSADGLR